MIVVLTLAGGVALLLFGVRYLRKGLDRILGPRLGATMQRLGTRRGLGFLTGLGVAVVAPSSTTVSVLSIQAVQDGHMTVRQMLAVMLGANIGLTVMVQLVALDLVAVAPALILFGFLLFQYAKRTWRGVGQLVLGLGFIFLAMGVIRNAVPADLAGSEEWAGMLSLLQGSPTLLVLMAAVMAMLVQSSTATIGLVIGFASTGAAGLSLGLPVVLGANVGLACTAAVIGWRQIESRRLALANLSLKVAIVLPALVMMPQFSNLVATLPGTVEGHIAAAHTGFNILLAIVGLPLVGVVSTLAARYVPDPPEPEQAPFGPRHLVSGPMDSVALALGQSQREILRVSDIARSMLTDVWRAMKQGDDQVAGTMGKRDDRIDLLDAEIKRYLTRISMEEADASQADEQMRQLRFINELETIGDIIDKNISELVLKKIRLQADFSEEGEADLDAFHGRVADTMRLAEAVFTTRDRSLARQILANKAALDAEEKAMRDRHFQRLKARLPQSHETSAIHLDLLTHLKRINSCASRIANGLVNPHGE